MSTYQQAMDLARETPSKRNRYVDLLRAFSILIVVVGHWLMARLWAWRAGRVAG